MCKKAYLYRMSNKQHICPYGLKSLHLLKKYGFDVDDRLLKTNEQTNSFKELHNVDTTPQIFISGLRIGGYEDLKKYLGISIDDTNKPTYTPIIVILSMTFLMALGICWRIFDSLEVTFLIEIFFALTMCVLAIQKLRDLSSFSLQFITYDLFAMQYVPYAYMYAAIEAGVGLGMLFNAPAWMVAVPALFIGTVGAISVIKAVYIDKRKLKCACVGGDSNVPLGVVSLIENLMMISMGIWMFLK